MNWDSVDIVVNRCRRDTWPSGRRHNAAFFKSRLVDYDFWFIWKGSGFFRVGTEKPFTLRRGACLLLRPGEPCECWQTDHSQLGVAWIHFDVFSRAPSKPLPPEALPGWYVEPDRSEFYDQLTSRIITLWYESSYRLPGNHKAPKPLLSVLMRALLASYEFDLARGQSEGVTGTDLHHRQVVSRALALFHEQYADIRSIADTAAVLGYCQDHFCRIFSRVTGRTPKRALMQIRMDQAKTLLLHSDASIADIAEKVGYESVFPFSRQFRQEFGSSPTVFRRNALA